jgi:adenine-specific DNA methylase
MSGPKRLIEVDLPIKAISAHARREKSVRRGHISTLHIWWARRPLVACRAVVLAALLPDPADEGCPPEFRAKAAEALQNRYGGRKLEDPLELRRTLLDFIAEFADWDRSTDPDYLSCSRSLIAALADEPPLVVDSFGGGGAIPFEALRVGADAWAADYNPVAALLLQTVLQDIPRYAEQLPALLRTWAPQVKKRVEADVGEFYPADSDGAVPIAYLWARTITCEGPACGAELPLLRQLWLAKKGRRKFALRPIVDHDTRSIDFAVVENPDRVEPAIVRGGSAVCPVCGFVTRRASVEKQLASRRGGASDARMIAVVLTSPGERRRYRAATDDDVEVTRRAAEELRRRVALAEESGLALLPLDSLSPIRPSPAARGVSAVTRYGMTTWADLFAPRQALSLSSFAAVLRDLQNEVRQEVDDPGLSRAVLTCLALPFSKMLDFGTSLTRWGNDDQGITGMFSRHALPMVWDFAEANPLEEKSWGWEWAVSWVENVYRHGALSKLRTGQASKGDARSLPLPDSSVQCVFTDPPYYDQIPYADLSDFFAEWLFRTLGEVYPDLFPTSTVDKSGELVVNAAHTVDGHPKDRAFFRDQMAVALREARRVLVPGGIAVVVFAHKETEGWEALLTALVDAGWTVTGSWPIETEMAHRIRAQGASSLQSSVHIVCRPRADDAGVGSWRDVRPEVEQRVSEWLPRLAEEGIEGADAIFACLGPALEAYSRFERVETAAGDPVPLSAPTDDPGAPALLPTVWGAVARTALSLVFEGAEAEGFEEDARLTALWLWTLKAAENGGVAVKDEPEEAEAEEGEDASTPRKPPKGLSLDYDTARKLAQALGAHLESLDHPGGIVEVKGSAARLCSLTERRRVLLGADGAMGAGDTTLFDSRETVPPELVPTGRTTLDRLHQAMLLFGDGRGDALRRLLAEPGYSSDEGFMRLARSLSALYPPSSQEKRWVDGVLATRAK